VPAVDRFNIGPIREQILKLSRVFTGFRTPQPSNVPDTQLLRPYILFGHGRVIP
jgi:hypothetical protein